MMDGANAPRREERDMIRNAECSPFAGSSERIVLLRTRETRSFVVGEAGTLLESASGAPFAARALGTTSALYALEDL